MSNINNDKDILVVFVPGSGCDGVYKKNESGKVSGSMEIFALSYIDEIKLMVLEPPGIPRQYSSPEPGVAEGCPIEYFKYSNFDARFKYYLNAINDVKKNMVKINKIMFIGVSEGVDFAIRLAQDVPETSMITLISGFGIGQVRRMSNMLR